MLTLFLSILAVTITAYILHSRIRKKLGISKATLHMKMAGKSWTAATYWTDSRTGCAHSIVTTSVPMDGVISVYDDYKIHYHSKEPAQGMFRIMRYHVAARNWFFNRLEMQYIVQLDLRGKVISYGKSVFMRPLLLIRRATPSRTAKYPGVPLKRARA